MRHCRTPRAEDKIVRDFAIACLIAGIVVIAFATVMTLTFGGAA
jgi:hypothetical protein